ncbi:MAG: SDR family NAD(P)-dependent oxidoreductase [Myxococcota bacterium]
MKLDGQVAVITGANSGIGRVTANELAEDGAHVILACRSQEGAQAVIDEIEAKGGSAEYVHLDLNSIAAVRESAKEIRARAPKIDLLINNAGIAGTKGLSHDGFEVMYGVNHLGHFALTEGVLASLQAADSPRVVTVASTLHHKVEEFDFKTLREESADTGAMKGYGRAKLANVMFAKELGRRYPEITSYSVHPGTVETGIYRGVPAFIRPALFAYLRHFTPNGLVTAQEGAQTTLHAARCDASTAPNGTYFDKSKPSEASEVARDPEIGSLLWDLSAKQVEQIA